MKGGGRGYYRNISLLSAWAHAPFMHNNAIGPEICGKPREPEVDFYSSPYVDPEGKPLANPPACWPFDTSVEGRYELYRRRCRSSSNPDSRIPKMFILDRDIVVDIAPKVSLLGRDIGLSLTIPAGFPAVDVNSLRYKDMVQDIVLVGRDPDQFEAKYATLLTAPRRDELREGLLAIRSELLETATLTGIELVLGPQGGGGRPGPGPHAPGRQRVRPALLFEPPRAPGEQRPHLRRDPERARQAGAHRLRGDAVRGRR